MTNITNMTYAASWQPATPEIGEALENIITITRLNPVYTGNKQPRLNKNDQRNLLIDARVRLIELHKPRMALAEDQLRADRTIRHLLSHKLSVYSYPVPKTLPVWSR